MARRFARKGKDWCAATLMLIAITAGPARVFAQTADDDPGTKRARELYRDAAKAYEGGDFKKAVRGFREANQLKSGIPELLRALGLAEVRTDAFVDGANHLTAWLRVAPAGTEDRRTAEAILKAAEVHVGRLELNAQPTDAIIEVDQRRQAERHLPLYVEPGEHLIVASLGTRKVERRVVIGAGQVATIELLLPASPEPSAPLEPLTPPATGSESVPLLTLTRATERRQTETPPASAYARAIVLGIGVGATFAGLAVGTVGLSDHFAANARAAEREREVNEKGLSCSSASAPLACQLRDENRRDAANALGTTALLGFVAAGVAGTATLAGIIWWPTWHPQNRDAFLTIRPIPGGLTASGEF